MPVPKEIEQRAKELDRERRELWEEWNYWHHELHYIPEDFFIHKTIDEKTARKEFLEARQQADEYSSKLKENKQKMFELYHPKEEK